MKPLQAGLAVVIGLGTIGAGSWVGGVQAVDWLDQRYAPLAAFEDMAWSQLKADIRELRERIRHAENPQLRQDLEEDLRDLIDRFCRNYPQDRECE